MNLPFFWVMRLFPVRANDAQTKHLHLKYTNTVLDQEELINGVNVTKTRNSPVAYKYH